MVIILRRTLMGAPAEAFGPYHRSDAERYAAHMRTSWSGHDQHKVDIVPIRKPSFESVAPSAE